MTDDGGAFLNRASGTFTEGSVEWVLAADQWSQTYYQLREGKLYLVENDNKEQQHVEREVNIDAFVREHAASRATPHAAMVAFFLEHHLATR